MFASDVLLPTISITGESLISCEFLAINDVPKTEWVFFTSKNSVKAFFQEKRNLENLKLACVGTGTAATLKRYTNHIDFIGEQVDIRAVGKSFDKVLKTDTCLFPISSISKRNVQKQITNQNQVVDLVVYQTAIKPITKPISADIIIFTSPSNVESFKQTNAFNNDCKYIAMGKSTAEQLTKSGCNTYTIPKSSGEMGLINAIYRLL